MTVITSSSTLATLLFGLVAIITRQESFALPGGARIFLVVAIAAFAVAALGAISVNLPREYRGARVEPVRDAIKQWGDDRKTALQRVALTQLEVLQAAKDRNNAKAKSLTLAIASEAAAVVSLTIALALVLAG